MSPLCISWRLWQISHHLEKQSPRIERTRRHDTFPGDSRKPFAIQRCGTQPTTTILKEGHQDKAQGSTFERKFETLLSEPYVPFARIKPYGADADSLLILHTEKPSILDGEALMIHSVDVPYPVSRSFPFHPSIRRTPSMRNSGNVFVLNIVSKIHPINPLKSPIILKVCRHLMRLHSGSNHGW